MKRLFAWLSLISACGALGGACSSSAGDQELCARAEACIGAAGGRFGGTCEILAEYTHLDPSFLGSEGQAILASLHCVQSASDCVGAKACVTATATQAAACKTGSLDRCSGDVAVRCQAAAGGTPEILDCGAAGLKCFENDAGAACGTAACDTQTAKPTCDGDNLVACAPGSGALQVTSCHLFAGVTCTTDGTGQTCRTQVAETCGVVGGVAQCVGAGDACEAKTFAQKCDGTTIVTCTGGKVARLDCGAVDARLTCLDQGGGVLGCGGAGTDCTETTAETCVDGVITYCMWGTTTSLDCKSLGYTGCTSKNATAGCTAP